MQGRLLGDVPELNVGKWVRVRWISASVERAFVDFALAHGVGQCGQPFERVQFAVPLVRLRACRPAASSMISSVMAS